MNYQTYKLNFLASIILLLFTTVSFAQRPKPEETEILGHTMYTLLKPGDIPAIFEPDYIPVTDAESLYYANEPLIVVVDGKTAKGFSTWHLDQHEIVNDYINGKAITVTW